VGIAERSVRNAEHGTPASLRGGGGSVANERIATNESVRRTRSYRPLGLLPASNETFLSVHVRRTCIS
jgi:hypothetical protein